MRILSTAARLRAALVVLVAVGFAPRNAAAQNLVINEVMAANLGEAIDPSWNFGGWVEIYNPTMKAVSLDGLVLAAPAKGGQGTGDQTYKLTKAHGSVPAGGYRCLWFGHNDKDFPQQVDFKLDCDGGRIALIASGGATIDEVLYPEAVSRTSWARTTDAGGEWAYCSWPTPEAANAHFPAVGHAGQGTAVRTPAPAPSHPGGWLEGPCTFDVSVAPGATLYYTTDGTAPTASSPRAALDASSSARFEVTANAVYRFRAESPGALPSQVVTRSFITRSYTKVITDYWDWGDWGDGGWWPGGGGWPTTEETTTFAGFSLLSVVADPQYLYDDNIGIYVDGTNGGWSYWGYANYYRDWDRPVNVEIYDPEGVPLVNQEVDMSMSGGYSRMNDVKSFKLKSGKKFEDAAYFPLTGLFDEKPYGRYKDILVRSGGSTMVDRHQDNALQFVARRSGFYVDTQAFRPVYVFLNGDYLETLFMREPSNRQYGYSNYGMDTDAMDTLEESDITGVSLTHGTWDAFGELYDAALEAPADDDQWRRVEELLDVDAFANYFALELFLANQDWPQNNIKLFREDNDAPHAGRFHVVVQDLDACFHETGNTFERLDTYEFYPYAHVGRQENILLTLFLHLMGREEFRQRFVDAFCLVAGSVYEPSAVADDLAVLTTTLAAGYVEKRGEMTSALNQVKNQLTAAWARKRVEYLQRWGRARLSAAKSVTATIGGGLSAAGEALQEMPATVLLNGQPIPRGRFSGTLFLPVTLEAQELVGKEFAGWMRNGQMVSAERAISLAEGGEYRAVYRVATADGAAAPVVVNEVCADNGYCQSPRLKRSDWIELYNATEEDFDTEGLYVSDDENDPFKYRLPATSPATVVPAHGHLVLWADDHQLPFKLANADGAAVIVTAADGAWSNTLRYVAHDDRKSVGRWPDGGTATYVMAHPTVGSGNVATSAMERLEWPEVPVGVLPPLLPGTPQPVDPTADGADRFPSVVYDLQGRRADSRHRGIVIKGGEKVVR